METGKANKIQSSTFRNSLSESYHLIVQIGIKNLSYLIKNTKNNQLEFFNSYVNEDYVDILNKDEILKLKFAKSSIIYSDFVSTLIPYEFYKKENIKDILKLNTDLKDIIKSDFIFSINSYMVYSIPNFINDIVLSLFQNANQISKQTILIEEFLNYENINDHAYIYLSKNKLHITIIKNKNLILNNIFNFKTSEDILYFTLFTFEQLKIDTETVNVKVFGEIIKEDYSFQLLYNYIRKVSIKKFKSTQIISSEFKELNTKKFQILLSH